MAHEITRSDDARRREEERRRALLNGAIASVGALGLAASPLLAEFSPAVLFGLSAFPALALGNAGRVLAAHAAVEHERGRESALRGGRPVIGMPPRRDCFQRALAEARRHGRDMIDRYLVGFDLGSGEPLWVDDDEICRHAAVFGGAGKDKTLWMEALIYQQMLRGRASGCTFIDAKPDSDTLNHLILMALLTGRIEDLIIVDPLSETHAYNFLLTHQSAEIKTRKLLRAGLLSSSAHGAVKQQERSAGESLTRLVRAFESFGLSWSLRDITATLSSFERAYPHLRELLTKSGSDAALAEIGQLVASYRKAKGSPETPTGADVLRRIGAELRAISGGEDGELFSPAHTDLVLTDALLRGKIIYYRVPPTEDAQSAERMVRVFREDLAVSMGEITALRYHRLEDPHLIMIDEESSILGPTFAHLFELARRDRFGMIFGARTQGDSSESSTGLSTPFIEKIMANVSLRVMMVGGESRALRESSDGALPATTRERGAGAGIPPSPSTARQRLDPHHRALGQHSPHRATTGSESSDRSADDPVTQERISEQGMAWFEMGDGRIVKGRSFFFAPELHDRWQGREFVSRLERVESDELGFGRWIEEVILAEEESESSGALRPSEVPPGGAATPRQTVALTPEDLASIHSAEESNGPFKLSLVGRTRSRTTTKTELQRQDEGGVPHHTTDAPKVSDPERIERSRAVVGASAALIEGGKESIGSPLKKKQPG